jgi:hypothetical protein
MPTVLGGLADFERDLIRARTGERAGSGRRSAGVKFVRMPKLEKIDWQSPLQVRLWSDCVNGHSGYPTVLALVRNMVPVLTSAQTELARFPRVEP